MTSTAAAWPTLEPLGGSLLLAEAPEFLAELDTDGDNPTASREAAEEAARLRREMNLPA